MQPGASYGSVGRTLLSVLKQLGAQARYLQNRPFIQLGLYAVNVKEEYFLKAQARHHKEIVLL